MDRRFLTVLGLSLIFALVVSTIFYYQVTGQSSSPVPVQTDLKDVVTAAKPLPVGVTIKPGDVKLSKVTADQFPRGAFTRVEEVLDRPVVSNVLSEEPVLEGRLAARGSGLGLAPIIPVGMRAVSVHVTDVAGVSGFVLPGLRVDVLVTGQPPGGNGSQTTTCLQNILVLSAGQTIQPDARGQAIQTPTVTLLVSPEQAETLTLAGNEGKIQLILRNSSDQEMAKTPGTHIARLYKANNPTPAAPVERSAAPRPRPRPVAAAPVISMPVPQITPPSEIVVIRGPNKTVEVVPAKAN
jgi:pilus assembly protein CpaB